MTWWVAVGSNNSESWRCNECLEVLYTFFTSKPSIHHLTIASTTPVTSSSQVPTLPGCIDLLRMLWPLSAPSSTWTTTSPFRRRRNCFPWAEAKSNQVIWCISHPAALLWRKLLAAPTLVCVWHAPWLLHAASPCLRPTHLWANSNLLAGC